MPDDYPPDDYVEALCKSLCADRIQPLLTPREPMPGLSQWRTSHGQAIVGWVARCALAASNVLLVDGRRVNAAFEGPEWRRRSDEPSLRYQWGTVMISDDEVRFFDCAVPLYEPPPVGDVPSMERDLAGDATFVADLKDVRFAIAAFHMLVHGDGWIHADGCEGEDYLGRGRAAYLIAGLRALGEGVGDFKYWDVPPGEPSPNALMKRVHEHLTRLGWRLRRSDEWYS